MSDASAGRKLIKGKGDGTIRCGVIGVGRMGRHHARVYAQMEGCELVGVVDPDVQRCADTTEKWGGKSFPSVEALIDAGVDAVTIATPTMRHRAAAEPLLAAGVACLIEKPLAPDVTESQAIVDAADRVGAILQVGHIVRYDPVMIAIRKLGDLAPRFVELDRISPMTFRSIDVSVVLDMMIHDLDLLLMLVGSEPESIQASAVSVLSELADVCNARLTFPPDSRGARCVANVTASRLAMKTERKIRLISEDIYISADFSERKGTVARKHANAEQLAVIRERIRAGDDLSDVNYLDLVEVEELQVENAEPLTLQLQDFLSAVREGRRPTVDARAGFAAVRTAERILEAAKAMGARQV
jgi:predicted dehydrogenase